MKTNRMNIRGRFCLFVFILVIFFITCSSSQESFDEKKWRSSVENAGRDKLYAPHYRDSRYFNPWMPMKEKGFLTFLKWRLSSKNYKFTENEESYRPKIIKDPVKRIKDLADKNFIMWIGHNTFLIRINGQYWLSDPIFSERALLPKRKTPPGITLDDLLKVTREINVIISHNHYDHLDEDSILGLPENTKVYAPLGLKKYIQGLEKKNVRELDWWQSIDLGEGVKLVCLPAQHWSRRITQGVNTTLWAGFLLITPSLKVYFGGDSGYFIGYKEIGEKFPGIDYALIPTTAYMPRWFMHYAHMDVPEALDAFSDLGAKYFIPTQWGTFELGDGPIGYPALDLKRNIEKRKLDRSRFIIMDIGGIYVIPGRTAVEK